MEFTFELDYYRKGWKYGVLYVVADTNNIHCCHRRFTYLGRTLFMKKKKLLISALCVGMAVAQMPVGVFAAVEDPRGFDS